MDVWPGVSVLIPTYNRLQIVADTVAQLHQLIQYPGPITYWLGVDNDKESAAQVRTFIHKQTGVQVNAVDGPRRRNPRSRGYLGANLNMLLQASRNDNLLLQMDDDHKLLRCLDLRSHVEKLMADETSGWVRLMGVGFHNYCGCLEGRYWKVDWACSELYIPSNRPHLKHRRFHNFFGLYPEGMKLGETEESFCHQCKDKARGASNCPHVLVPLDVLTESSWDHIGQSFQLMGE
jgi:hypothetical protein